MRTLCAQLYEQGQFHDAAFQQKRGLVNAFAEQGAVLDFDYLANDPTTLWQGFINRIDSFEPTLVWTQLHGADRATIDGVAMLRQRYPGVTFVNWSGDSWSWSLTSAPILELASHYDLWLVAAPDVLPIYAEHGIQARFWQIGYEPPLLPLPDMPTYDVVFLGNVISEPRRRLLECLRGLSDLSVGIYGDWSGANGHNTYHFAEGEALYKNAILAIADCAYPDQRNYISNRPLQIGAAGGALLLHQYVERMDILSGLVPGLHYVEWQTLANLPDVLYDWLRPERAKERAAMVAACQAFVLANHHWQNRVAQLFEWLPELQGEKA